MEVGQEDLEVEAAAGSDGGKALALAYRFLNRRERTVAEVWARLEKAEIPQAAIEAVVAELVEFGYLDDARYARVFTQDKRTLEGWGSERISRALRERGVDRELIESVLGKGLEAAEAGAYGAEAAGDEFARAVTLLRQRFSTGPADRRERERAFGFLARKGYDSETAADAVRSWARGSTGDTAD